MAVLALYTHVMLYLSVPVTWSIAVTQGRRERSNVLYLWCLSGKMWACSTVPTHPLLSPLGRRHYNYTRNISVIMYLLLYSHILFSTSKLKFCKNVLNIYRKRLAILKCRTYIYEKPKNCNSLWILRGLQHSKAFLQTDYVHLQNFTWTDEKMRGKIRHTVFKEEMHFVYSKCQC